MFPTGSRFLIGATLLAVVTAIIYGSTVWGSLGTTGLIFASAVLAMLAGVAIYTRDADVSVKDPAAATDAPAARPAPQSSMWPLVAALGAVLVVVGLVTYPVVFVFGIIALLAATIEWMIEAWSERASADRRFNLDVRERISHPAEFPVLAALAAGVIVYSFSRIMLFLSRTGGPVAFGAVAALVLVVGFVIAYRPQLRGATVSAVAAIAVLGLVAGGIAAALAGERDIERHETTGLLAAEGHCDTAEETHADDNASQTVGAKANIHGDIVLRSDGTLVARTEGIEGDLDELVVARSNPTNVRFRNETDVDRRLVLDLGEEVADGADTDDEADEDHGEGTARRQLCTAMAEEGGTQFLTFEIGAGSSEQNRYQFVVPGVDGQAVEVIVP